MTNTSLYGVLAPCLVVGSLVAWPAYGSTHVAAPAACSGASDCLREGTKLEAQGDLAQAGDAYRQALLALSERAQRGEEGASAALLAAKAHWRAFDRDPDPARLAAGIEVLELWLGLAGTRDAALVDEVRGESERLHASLEPLLAGDAAFEQGDATKASLHYHDALTALAREPEDWSIGANLAVRLAGRYVARYDSSFASATDIELRLQELRIVEPMLEGWRGKQPSDQGDRGEALDHALAGVRGRVAEGERALTAQPEPGPTTEPESIPTRPEVAKGTGLLLGAGVTTTLAWVGALIRSGAASQCRAGEYSCKGEAGTFVIALTPLGWVLGASSDVLAALAGARRGKYDGVAAGWDGAPQRKAGVLKGVGAALLGVGVAGRVASVVLWFKDFASIGSLDGNYSVLHPFFAQLSASAMSAGGGLLAYGITYDEHRASEQQRSRLAGVTHPSNQRRSGWRYTGITVASAGLVVTGAGVALLAKGAERWQASTEEAATAASIEAMYDGVYDVYAVPGTRYDDASFAADLKEARRSISGLLIGSYVLVASGIATSVVGLTLVGSGRPASRTTRRAWVRPSTVVSPTLSMLTVSGRF